MAIASLALRLRPETSRLGIGITVAALIVMPILAKLKRGEARRSNNAALAADAVTARGQASANAAQNLFAMDASHPFIIAGPSGNDLREYYPAVAQREPETGQNGAAVRHIGHASRRVQQMEWVD